ncbi:hypothetical protein [Prescottella equi]|uniref:hypothetical protein n=1 Tax=Rhodococcus hoagii TaxID=43767 RepID=UPI000A4137FE|nr:hypothetical protein [Prescottella equi]
MSKKPKQSRHRVPPEYVRPADPVDERYQAEIDRSVNRLTKQYEAAARHLAALERRAERARQTAEAQSTAKARAEEIATNRAEAERLLTQRIEEIKEAAKRARVDGARRELDRRRAEVETERRRATEERKAQLRQARERETRLRASRASLAGLELQIEERRRELREIERLMMPSHYGNRDSRSRGARHETGAGQVHLGGYVKESA